LRDFIDRAEAFHQAHLGTRGGPECQHGGHDQEVLGTLAVNDEESPDDILGTRGDYVVEQTGDGPRNGFGLGLNKDGGEGSENREKRK